MDIAKLTNLTGNLAYESSNNNIVKISNDGKITGVSVGQGIIKAQKTLDTIDSDSFLFEIVDSIDFNNLNWRENTQNVGTYSKKPFTLSVSGSWKSAVFLSMDIVCLRSGVVDFTFTGVPWDYNVCAYEVSFANGYLEQKNEIARNEVGVKYKWR